VIYNKIYFITGRMSSVLPCQIKQSKQF